jgi:hypothetical protein
MSMEAVIGGRGVMGSMVWTPAPGMAKSIVAVRPGRLLASRMAWRSDPGPLSAVVLTTATRAPSVITNRVSSDGAPADWALRVRLVKTWAPGDGVYRSPFNAALRAESEPL